jgi:hypothetical protein
MILALILSLFSSNYNPDCIEMELQFYKDCSIEHPDDSICSEIFIQTTQLCKIDQEDMWDDWS